MEIKWINIKDKLPDESGWYMVFAPSFWSKQKEFRFGLGFSKFTLPKDGHGWFGIDKSPTAKTQILYWAPLPFPTDMGHFEERENSWGGKSNVWVENVCFGRNPTFDEIDDGKAEWCWACDNPSCDHAKQDVMMLCEHFHRRSLDDMKTDPHYGGN